MTQKKIVRKIEFTPEYAQSGMVLVSYFAEFFREKYPDEAVSVTIEQNKNTLRLIIKTPSGLKEEIESVLENYGLVIRGQKPLDEFFTNSTQATEFVHRLEVAKNLLLPLLTTQESPPSQIVEITDIILSELLIYLKSHPNDLYNIKPRQFEELIAEILASFGWQVGLTATSKDGGYDIFAISADKKVGTETSWLIECKRYAPNRKVGIDIVRSLYGVNLDIQASNIMLATTSHFTSGVHELKTSRYNLALKDYEGILDWLNKYRPNPNGRLYLNENKLVLP